MKKLLACLLVTSVPLCAAMFEGTVAADTYIRNDGTPNSVNNEDTDNEVLVGSNGSLNNMRGLLSFDVSSIVNDVNSIGGGNFANLTVNAATLQVFERRGRANTVNIVVSDYSFPFDPAASSWNVPAAADSTAGGTVGTPLGMQSLTWDATADNQDAIITLSGSLLQASIATHIAGKVNLVLTTDTAATRFLSFTSDRSANTARHVRLVVDYTVTPAGGPELTLDSASPNLNFTFPYSQTTASPLTRTLRFKNTSNTDPITLEGVAITNNGGGVFALGVVSPVTPVTLAVGQSIDIPVTASSSAFGAFTGSIFVDTNVALQDKTLPLNATFYQSGQMFGANPSMTTGLVSWGGGSNWVSPGLIGFSGDGMARIRGKGDPQVPPVLSSHNQSTSIPNNLRDWVLDFRFSTVDPSKFKDYSYVNPTGLPASGEFTDRTFQLVIQANDIVPSPSLTDALNQNTLINIAYLPDGVTTGGTAGFYQFNQGAWEFLDFNGDGSALLLAGSIDVDADSDPSNGVGDGILNPASGDTVRIYRMTLKGTGFGTPSANYSITLDGPGAGFPKTVSGLTGFHNQDLAAALPAAFSFISSDTSTDSNAGLGYCPSFWVDEVGWFAVDRPASRLLLFNEPSLIRSFNGAAGGHDMTVFNDGTGALSINAAITGASLITVTTPAPLLASIPSGVSQILALGYDPAGFSLPNTAAFAGVLTLTSNDFNSPSIAYSLTASEVTNSNIVANGDMESDSTGTTFPVGWASTGAVANNTGVAELAASSTLWQDFGGGPTVSTADMNNFQVDFRIAVDAFNINGSRIRLRGANNSGSEDVLAIRFDGNGIQTADSKTGAIIWQTALATPLAINTDLHVRIIGEGFDSVATRRYKFGLSADGVSYTFGDWLTATHTYNATNAWDVETITFESGTGVKMLVDNVVVAPRGAPTYLSWMQGFTFAPGADITPNGDADNDGVSNLLEQVLGTAPNAATTGPTQVGGTANSVTFKHSLNPNLASDVTYSYQWSSDLIEWNPSGQSNAAGTTTTINVGMPVSGEVTVTATVSSGTASKLFTRIVARQATP